MRHTAVGDKVEMYGNHHGEWELRDVGTVIYIGPGYATVEFWKNRDLFGTINLKLTQKGIIDRKQRPFGYSFL